MLLVIVDNPVVFRQMFQVDTDEKAKANDIVGQFLNLYDGAVVQGASYMKPSAWTPRTRQDAEMYACRTPLGYEPCKWKITVEYSSRDEEEVAVEFEVMASSCMLALEAMHEGLLSEHLGDRELDAYECASYKVKVDRVV